MGVFFIFAPLEFISLGAIKSTVSVRIFGRHMQRYIQCKGDLSPHTEKIIVTAGTELRVQFIEGRVALQQQQQNATTYLMCTYYVLNIKKAVRVNIKV